MSYSFSRQKQSSTSSVFDHAPVVYFDHCKTEELKRAGYQVVELWECDFDKRFKEDPDFRTLVDSEFANLDPCDQEMLYLVEGLTQQNSIRKSMNPPMKKSSTLMCVHSTQMFPSTDCFHLDIPPSILKRILTKTISTELWIDQV